MRITKLLFALLMAMFIITGCGKKDDAREIIDRSGRPVIIKGNTFNRIISTAPSNTEIITDLGQAHRLIAIDVHSANISALPPGLTLLDFFYPDAEVIVTLEPDLIIASGHNPTGTGEDPFKLLTDMGIPVVYISMSKSVEEIYNDITFVADLLQVKKEGEDLIASTRAQISRIADNISRQTSHYEKRPSVYFELSAPPYIMSFGKNSYIDDMISIIGARNIFADEDWLVMPSVEVVIERNPDIILTNVNYIENPAAEIKDRLGFNHINAVLNDRIYEIDNDSSSRPSARVLLALRQMAEAVYPELGAQ
ncbi:MAG: ABC transporter substrate-binding protein [Treponema sp.]|nr:ABC transporter substrate-binding protein [Treponema sp.]